MNKIDDILNSLQGQQPIIGDSKALTDSIMARLDAHTAHPQLAHPRPLPKGGEPKVAEDTPEKNTSGYESPSLGEGGGVGRPRGESFMLSAVRIVLTMAAAWLVGLFIYQQLTDKRALQGSASYVADLPQGQALKDAYLRSMQKERQQTLSYTFVKKYINEKR